jgi:DNA polymerase III subunit delta
MQVASQQLAGQLAKGLRSLYTFHGDEPLQQQEGADAVRAAARSLAASIGQKCWRLVAP